MQDKAHAETHLLATDAGLAYDMTYRPYTDAPLDVSWRVTPSPTLSPTDPVPRGLLTLCPAPTDPVPRAY